MARRTPPRRIWVVDADLDDEQAAALIRDEFGRGLGQKACDCARRHRGRRRAAGRELEMRVAPGQRSLQVTEVISVDSSTAACTPRRSSGRASRD
jgi:hypothetical protein